MIVDGRDKLRTLVDRWAVAEGRTNSPLAALAFYRMSQRQFCTKAVVNGVTLAVVVQGTKGVRVHGLELAVEPMQELVFTGETTLETTCQAASDGPYLSLGLTFSPETIVKCLMALAGAGAPPKAERVPAFVSELEPAVLDALVRLLGCLDDPVERQLIGPLAVEECALRLLRSDAAAAFRSAVGKDGDLARIEQAIRFMQSNRARALSVADIARHVGMSESHFAHRFRDVAGLSPMRYLRQTRLDHARTLMLSEGARPSEAAARVGFESASHFTREFKRAYGAPPADYARRFRAAAS